RLNDVAGDEWCSLCRTLFRALDAAFPLQHGPALESVLRQLGENPCEVYLPIPRRTKSSGALQPRLKTAVHALFAAGPELRVLHVEDFDSLVIKIDVFQIIELLQHKVAGVKQNI